VASVSYYGLPSNEYIPVAINDAKQVLGDAGNGNGGSRKSCSILKDIQPLRHLFSLVPRGKIFKAFKAPLQSISLVSITKAMSLDR
jgi:hypothetical protein